MLRAISISHLEKKSNEKALEKKSLFQYSSVDPNDDWRDCGFLIRASQQCEKNRGGMHIMDARLSRVGLGWTDPSVRRNCRVLSDAGARRLVSSLLGSEELINTRDRAEELSLSRNMAMFTLAPSHVAGFRPCIISPAPQF